MNINIQIAKTDEEITSCYSVMRELRPHVAEIDFVSRVRRQENSGYRLVYLQDVSNIVAVAGFRTGENLAWGRFLYVDDFVTLPACRSKGYGSKLFEWIKAYAAKQGCQQLHLDSGIQRKDAHRFYEREGMTMASLHFVENIVPVDSRL